MTLGTAFWVIMLLWIILTAWPIYAPPFPLWPGHILAFFLFLILGWHAFGPPLK